MTTKAREARIARLEAARGEATTEADASWLDRYTPAQIEHIRAVREEESAAARPGDRDDLSRYSVAQLERIRMSYVLPGEPSPILLPAEVPEPEVVPLDFDGEFGP